MRRQSTLVGTQRNSPLGHVGRIDRLIGPRLTSRHWQKPCRTEWAKASLTARPLCTVSGLCCLKLTTSGFCRTCSYHTGVSNPQAPIHDPFPRWVNSCTPELVRAGCIRTKIGGKWIYSPQFGAENCATLCQGVEARHVPGGIHTFQDATSRQRQRNGRRTCRRSAYSTRIRGAEANGRRPHHQSNRAHIGDFVQNRGVPSFPYFGQDRGGDDRLRREVGDPKRPDRAIARSVVYFPNPRGLLRAWISVAGADAAAHPLRQPLGS